MSFANLYGPWALVTGGANGIGRAFAHGLARRGLSVIVLDVSERAHEVVAELETQHGVSARALVCDLRNPALLSLVEGACAELDIGTFVANAAVSKVGPFVEQELSDLVDALEINCRVPLQLTHHFARRLVKRGRGGIFLLSSLSAFWGTPLFANYAGTKAYNLALAEALWDELAPLGVHVLGVCPGATDTPSLRRITRWPLPSTIPLTSPEQVAEESLRWLGRGPVCIPGLPNRLISTVMGRLLPRSLMVRLNGKNSRQVWG
jgi:short-subunit dehydrogenase